MIASHRLSAVFLTLMLALLAWTGGAGAQEARFPVTGYAVEGENPLSAAETEALLGPYRGEQVTLDQLQSAAAALESELKARGFGFLRVVLPPQEARGVIRLRVLSFRLDAIRVSGNRAFDRDNVLQALPALQSGESPNLREVARAQSLANDHPARQVTVTLHQGGQPDTVDAEVAVSERAPQQFFASLDNSGSKDTGRLRLGVGYQHANLFNRDHALTFSYTTSPGHAGEVRQYGMHYRAPVYSMNGALTAYYTRSDTNSGTVAQFFSVSGSGEFYGLRWTHQLLPVRGYSHTAEIGVEQRHFFNDVSFAGAPIGTDVASRPLILRYAGQYQAAGFGLRHSIELARNLRGGSDNRDAHYAANRAGADTHWQAWRYALEISQALGNWAAVARLKGQASRDALIPGEQFGLGGAASVRGLPERDASGESGHALNLELHTPQLAEGLRALAFVDAGRVRPRPASSAQPRQNALSAGFGVRYQWRQNLSLAADWARLLDGTEATGGNHSRLHAALVYRF